MQFRIRAGKRFCDVINRTDPVSTDPLPLRHDDSRQFEYCLAFSVRRMLPRLAVKVKSVFENRYYLASNQSAVDSDSQCSRYYPIRPR